MDWAFLLAHTASLGLVVLLLWISLPLRTVSWFTWNDICVCLVFKYSQGHIFITSFRVLSWCLPSVSCPTIRMSSAIPNTFGRSLKISSIIHCNTSPAGTMQSGRQVNLYLPNIHVTNVVQWEDFHWVSGCGTLNLHQLLSHMVHLLRWEVYCLILTLCVLTLLMPA